MGPSYDEIAQNTLQTCTNLANALTNFGSVLYANGYNYAISNTSNPPNPGIQKVGDYDVTIPTSVHDNGIGIKHSGGASAFFDGLVASVLSEFGKLPNGDIDKLDTAKTSWEAFAGHETVSGAGARISAISALFDGLDDAGNRQLIHDHFSTLRTGADDVVEGARTVAASVNDYHTGTVDLGGEIASLINQLELTIAVIAVGAGVAFLFSLGTSAAVGGAAIAADVAATATSIRSAYQASNLLEVVGLATVAAGAVGMIAPFDCLPSLQRSMTALAGIVALRVIVDETGALTTATAYDDLPLAPDAKKPEGFTDESEEHVRDSHFPGGSDVTEKKSVFREEVDLEELAKAAADVEAHGPNRRGNFERVVEAVEEIGNVSKMLGGQPTKYYKVITDPWGTVMSIYPI